MSILEAGHAPKIDCLRGGAALRIGGEDLFQKGLGGFQLVRVDVYLCRSQKEGGNELLISLGGGIMAAAQTENPSQEKIPIGLAEEVVLLPWAVRLTARIDTGAAVTSLDARNLVVKDGMAEFLLPTRKGSVQVRLPVVAVQPVRSASGSQRRPVVEMDICVGPKVVRAQVNLIDRSGMKYPMIIGRNILERGYVVDCVCVNILKPSCAGVASQ